MAIDKNLKRSRALLSDYQTAFSTDAGKRVLWDLMKGARMLDSTLDVDPLRMAHNEGGRFIILHILKKLKIDIIALEAQTEEGYEYDREFWTE